MQRQNKVQHSFVWKFFGVWLDVDPATKLYCQSCPKKLVACGADATNLVRWISSANQISYYYIKHIITNYFLLQLTF